ncbi:MAG: hypothetical protein EYC70_09735 [Planctomycetota bacterium]|nr:MAG: hypothetical protein EYC70_09735 [Planctomycetota bacterium]
MKSASAHRPVRVGIFDSVAAADRAVHALHQAGFGRDELTVVCPEKQVQAFHEDPSSFRHEDPAPAETRRWIAEGSAIGAVLGGLVAVAGLVGTGGTALLVAGPLLVAAGGGAVAGGFVGAMLERGFEKDIVDYYDNALERGKVLVAVEADASTRLEEAQRILVENGAETVALPRT